MQFEKHVARAGYIVRGPLDRDLVAPRTDIDTQPVLDLHEIGIELAEQRAEHGLLIEFDLHPDTPRGVAAVFGVGNLARFRGAVRFSGHRLPSSSAHPNVGAGAALASEGRRIAGGKSRK